jgi:hypothetical protein
MQKERCGRLEERKLNEKRTAYGFRVSFSSQYGQGTGKKGHTGENNLSNLFRSVFIGNQAISHWGGLRKIQLRRYVAVRGNNEAANLGSSETGHPNMSSSQTSYRELPR